MARRRHRAAAVPAGRVQVLRPPAGLGRVRRRGGGRRRQDEELLLDVRADRPRQAGVAAEARQLRRALVVAAACSLYMYNVECLTAKGQKRFCSHH